MSHKRKSARVLGGLGRGTGTWDARKTCRPKILPSQPQATPRSSKLTYALRTMPQVSAHLQQTRMYVGPLRFAVRHLITKANPSLLAFPLLIAPSVSPYDAERLVGVATLDELITGRSTRVEVGAGLIARPLDLFINTSSSIVGARAGDVLVIHNTSPEWGDGGTTTRMVKASVSSPGQAALAVTVTEPFWWKDNGSDGFTLTHQGDVTPYHTGNFWSAERSGGPADALDTGPCFDDRFQAMFQEGETALNHMVSIETYLNALIKSSGLDGTQFEQYGINPVEIDLPE